MFKGSHLILIFLMSRQQISDNSYFETNFNIVYFPICVHATAYKCYMYNMYMLSSFVLFPAFPHLPLHLYLFLGGPTEIPEVCA